MEKFIKKIICFVAISFLLIPIIESICHLIVPKISHHNIFAKSQNLIPKIDSNSIVFLGDSRLECGIKTEEITNKSGKVINLAMPGSNGFDIIEYMISNKIYPKTLIIGFTPNYGRYKNHNLNKLHYSTKNLIKESFKYWLKQNSFTYNKASINLFLAGKEPYFVNHEYDNYGNVVVKENGDFNKRMELQLKMYKNWNDRFNKNEFKNYLQKLSELVSLLDGKTNVYGIYMPTSDTILSLENDHYNKNEINNMFDYYMDFSDFQPNNDSSYFYDGSHLTLEYAHQFTKEINKSIEKHERTTMYKSH